jgi:hypothetical protein
MSDNLTERAQILCHAHIICITVLENIIICYQIFCNWRYQELVDPYMSISDYLNSFGNCDLTKGNINREGDETILFDDYTMVLENIIICYQIFCDLLLKSAFEWIFNVMQLILIKCK